MSRGKIVKPLIGAITEDALTTLIPGTSTIKYLAKRCVPSWLTRDYYLSWDKLNFVLAFYREMSMLRFNLNNKNHVLPQVLSVDNRDGHIALNQIKFKAEKTPFTLDQSCSGVSDKIFRRYRIFLATRRRKYFNGQLLRLSGVFSNGGNLTLAYQRVFYESVCRTNLVLDAREKADLHSIREIIHPGGRLEPLEASRIANPLGVNFLLFTADGRAVLPKRSRRVIVRPAQLSPSFSGDFEYTDGGGGILGESIIIREGSEEISLLEEHMVPGKISFLGLTRELTRGGKPEMFFAAQTNLTADDFFKLHKGARDQYEFMKASSWVFWPFGEEATKDATSDNDRYALRRSFEELLNAKGDTMSIPLLTNMVLWLRQRVGESFSG